MSVPGQRFRRPACPAPPGPRPLRSRLRLSPCRRVRTALPHAATRQPRGPRAPVVRFLLRVWGRHSPSLSWGVLSREMGTGEWQTGPTSCELSRTRSTVRGRRPKSSRRSAWVCPMGIGPCPPTPGSLDRCAQGQTPRAQTRLSLTLLPRAEETRTGVSPNAVTCAGVGEL